MALRSMSMVKNLEANLQDLSNRLKRMGFRPGAKRRSYVPKPGTAKGRPLGISNLEDKIVEEAVKRVLEPIYESMFEASSYGYRPQSSPHKCLDDARTNDPAERCQLYCGIRYSELLR